MYLEKIATSLAFLTLGVVINITTNDFLTATTLKLLFFLFILIKKYFQKYHNEFYLKYQYFFIGITFIVPGYVLGYFF